MIYNPYKRLLGLLPSRSVQVGVVVAYADGEATVELLGGSTIKARGVVAVADTVYVRDNVIEAPAPDLPVEIIEVGA